MQSITYMPVEKVTDAVGTVYDFEFLDLKFRTPRLHSLSHFPTEYLR